MTKSDAHVKDVTFVLRRRCPKRVLACNRPTLDRPTKTVVNPVDTERASAQNSVNASSDFFSELWSTTRRLVDLKAVSARPAYSRVNLPPTTATIVSRGLSSAEAALRFPRVYLSLDPGTSLEKRRSLGLHLADRGLLLHVIYCPPRVTVAETRSAASSTQLFRRQQILGRVRLGS
jgi:hypothetical protein